MNINEIRTLNPDYDLDKEDNTELINLMKETLDKYIMCRCSLSSALVDVEKDLVKISKEFVRRFD